MERFSDRYGYTKPSNIFVKEGLTKPIQDCICSCIDELEYDLRTISIDDYQNHANTYLDALFFSKEK